MLLYLLLIIVFGLIVLTSFIVVVFGIIKKRKKLIITWVIVLFIGIIGCVFSALTFTKKTFEYAKSKDFQNDAKKTSALVGATVGSVSSGIADGLAKGLDDEAISKLAHKSASIFGRSIKTMASTLDSTIGNKNIFLDESLENAGFELGRVTEKYNSKSNDLAIFIDFKKDFNGKIIVTNYDQTGKKIDVAKKVTTAKKGESKVEVFSFSTSDLGITTYYILSLDKK